MHRVLASFGLLFALGAAPFAAAAQEATGSGAITMVEALGTLRAWATSARDGDSLHVPTPSDDSPEARIHDERSKLFARMADYRRSCRADVRKANRDATLAVTLRCFRGLLSLQRTTLQRWQRLTEDAPGIPPAIAERETRAVRAWSEAIATVIDALDAGVYQGQQGLADVRRRLIVQYAVAAEDARLASRRALDAGWLLVSADALELLATQSEEASFAAWHSAVCLVDLLPGIESGAPALPRDLLSIAEGLAHYERNAPGCLTKVKNISQ